MWVLFVGGALDCFFLFGGVFLFACFIFVGLFCLLVWFLGVFSPPPQKKKEKDYNIFMTLNKKKPLDFILPKSVKP